MNTREEVEQFVDLARKIPVLDVRSPGEYEKGHIPGAVSFPLFTNKERAEVGTLYKQAGQGAAVNLGMALVQPKMKEMFREGLEQAKYGKLLVHCWRGGKRSEAVAGLLAVSGIDVHVLEGGYKSYRAWVLRQFDKSYGLSIVGGGTGSGKTEVLHAIQRQGAQTLDLEGMADHRGSAFGRLGATEDVTFTQFENRIAMTLHQNSDQHIWVEDESRTIGNLYIPNAFWHQMRAAQVYHIALPLAERMEILLRDYGQFPKAELEACVQRIARRLGGLRTQEALQALKNDDAEQVMEILLTYYDKSYAYSLNPRPAENILRIPFEKFDAEAIAAELIALQKAKK